MAFETTKQIKFVASVDGADRVRAGFKGIGDSMGGLRSASLNVGEALRGLFAAASAGAFVAFVNGAIDAKAKLYDLSLQTGISVEALGGLAKVARLSGTDMDAVAGASNKLSKALVTTNEDSEGAAQGIKALGLNYAQFKALAADEQMLAVARAMEGFADGTGKSATAMLLFGKTGATLLPFMKELTERGVMVSSQTTEQAKAAKEFKDNLELLKGAGEGWSNSIANAVLPQLVLLTKQMQEAKTWGERLWIVMQNMSANAGFDEVGKQTLALKRMNAELAKTEEHFDSLLAAQAKGGLNAYGALDLEQTRAKMDNLRRAAMAASEQLKRVANQSLGLPAEGVGAAGPLDTRHYPSKPQVKVPDLDAARKAADAARKAAEEALKNAMDLAKARSTLRQAEEAAIAEFDLAEDQRRNKEVQAAQNAVRAAQFEYDIQGLLRSQIEALTLQRLRDKQAAFVVGSENFEAVQREIQAQQELIDIVERGERRDKFRLDTYRNDPTAGAERAVKDYLDEVKAAGLATERVVGNAMRSLEDGMVDLFTKGKFDARSFIDTLISEFIRLRVVKPLLADIFGGTGFGGGAGGLGSLFSSFLGLFGGGGGGGGGGVDYSLSGAGVRFGGPRAAGGPVQGGVPYLIGERGPELFVPRSAGAVVPNSALGGRQLVINQSITNNIDSRSDRAQVAQATAQAVQAGNRQLLEMLHARGAI